MTIPTYTRTDTLLSIENVCLTLGGKPILKNVTAKIDDLKMDHIAGQVVAFLGPSGIGKTQLLRILAGLQAPTSGFVHLGTKRELARPGLVGLVSQSYFFYRNRTVLSNLVVAARQHGRTKVQAEADSRKILADFGLSDKANLYRSQLSGGQQQRIAIAQQMLCSEHFLLMDEPTAGLDPLSKETVCNLIVEVANTDDLNTIILVTHDISAAVAVADTVWLMGRDRTATGEIIPGARIVQEYDLISRGIWWGPTVRETSEYKETVAEIQGRFRTL